MSDMTAGQRFSEGPLSRAAALIYTLLIVELLFLVTAVPGLVALVLLERDAGNLPLAALCALPAGPALSAALYALHHRRLDLADLSPAAAFWRGYRANVRDVLMIWAPWLAGLTIVGINLANLSAAGVPGWWAGLLVAVAAVAVLWVANAVVIASLFRFRAVDVARLAAYSLARFPMATLGNACLVIVAGGVTLVATEAALALVAFAFAAALLRNSRPMIAEIKERFVAPH
jgi:hypothetical protein